MPLNYWKEDADDGSSDVEAIEPIDNGEPVEEAYLNRAPQNLRNRSEVVRVGHNDLEAVERSDRAMAFMSGLDVKVGVYDDGGYKFSCSSTGAEDTYDQHMIIVPLISPAKTSSSVPILAKLYYDDGSGGEFKIDVDGARKVAEGSHNIRFRMWKGTQSLGTAAIATIEGSPTTIPDPEFGPFTIAIELSKDDDTNIAGVVTAINSSDAATIVTAQVVSGAGNTVTDANWPPAADGPARLYEGDDGSVGGVDDEGYLIQASTLSQFFFSNGERMADGDVMVIDFETAKDRRLSTPELPGVPVGSLHLLSGDSRNTADNVGVIPICKRLGTALYFMNGLRIKLGEIDYLIDSPKQHTDDLRTELADQTGTPNGDHLIGCEAKASTNLTLAVGTLNDQLDTLAALGGEGAGTSGNLNIGAEGISGSPQSLTVGTVRAQAAELLGHYNNHTTGTDKHNIGDITDRPFVVVDAGGNGDYTSIGAAILDLDSVGGTILVKNGTYVESTTIPATLERSLRVIGESRDTDVVSSFGVRVEPSGANAIFDSASDFECPLIFENILFRQDQASEIFSFTGKTVANTQGRVEFRNCHFAQAASMGRMIESSVDFTARDCSFIGDVYTFAQTAIKHYRTTGATKRAHFEYDNCLFDNWRKLFDIGDASHENDTGFFQLRNSTITSCGFTTGGAVAEPLIETTVGAGDLVRVQIDNNVWEESVGGTNGATFCLIQGLGTINNNRLLCGAAIDLTVTRTPIIYAKGDITGYLEVNNNVIYSRYGQGLFADGQVKADGNLIQEHTPNAADAWAIKMDSSYNIVINTEIDNGTIYTAPDYLVLIGPSCAASKFISNRIPLPDGGTTGIHMDGVSDVVVSWNQIWRVSYGTNVGIFVDDCDEVLIQGNRIGPSIHRGIVVDTSQVDSIRILDNLIEHSTNTSAATNTFGIWISDQVSLGEINNNTIRGACGVAASTDIAYGILVAGPVAAGGSLVISGNNVSINDANNSGSRALLLQNTVSGVTVSGNSFWVDAASTFYAVSIQSGSDNHLITGNRCEASGAATGIANHIDNQGANNGMGAAGAGGLAGNWTP